MLSSLARKRRVGWPSADLAGAEEGLVAEVVVLADEGPELAQLVGVAGLAGADLDAKVALEAGQVSSKAGTSIGTARRRRI